MDTPIVLITARLQLSAAPPPSLARTAARVSSFRAVAKRKARHSKPNCVNAAWTPHLSVADVRHDDDVRSLIDQTVSRFGRIDAAINNAGTEGQPGLIVDQTAES